MLIGIKFVGINVRSTCLISEKRESLCPRNLSSSTVAILKLSAINCSQVNLSRASMVQSVGDFEKSLDDLREELSSTRGQYQQACQEMTSLRDELTSSTHALEEKEQLLLTEVNISSWDLLINTFRVQYM